MSFYDTKTLIMVFYCLGRIAFFILRSFMWLAHNLDCNQPNLAAVNQAQSTKTTSKGPKILVFTWAWVLSKKGPSQPLNPKSLNLWIWVQLYYINLLFLSLLFNVELQSQLTRVYPKIINLLVCMRERERESETSYFFNHYNYP